MPVIGLLFSVFAGCLAGGIVPVINAELIVLAAAAAAPPEALLPIIVLASTGQMLGKTALFYAGRGAIHLPVGSPRLAAGLAGWTERWSSAGGAVVFASAAAGLPPFYALSMACGASGMGIRVFLTAGFAGRFVRFGVIAFAPHLFRIVTG